MVKVPLGDYLKADEVKNGDVVEFIDEGVEGESSTYKDQKGNPLPTFQIGIRLADGSVKKVSLNLTSRKIISAKYGSDSKDWVGKKASITVTLTMQGKKSMIFQPTETQWT